jgi:hypothetical protein
VAQDQLIPHSLICLHTCLEAVRVNEVCKRLYSGNSIRLFCSSSHCEHDFISSIAAHLDRFIVEPSKVLSLKENMNHKLWWLSVFYSLCIQSYVRRILLDLARNHVPPGTQQEGFKQYLHFALRLFIAASGAHDPLLVDY